jgi:hypothetical protein
LRNQQVRKENNTLFSFPNTTKEEKGGEEYEVF